MSSETTSIKLNKQEDWPAWFDLIKSEAEAAKIWRFVNPEEKTPSTNVEPDLLYYTKDRTITSTPSSTNPEKETPAPIPTLTSTPPNLLPTRSSNNTSLGKTPLGAGMPTRSSLPSMRGTKRASLPSPGLFEQPSDQTSPTTSSTSTNPTSSYKPSSE